jgi:catechol 2,3-dioxygenase-like lactoylglutathione lyase family enzyme
MIKGLLEIILYVQDMPKMVRFYRDILGLKISPTFKGQDVTDLYWVTFETGDCSLALHGGGKGNKGIDAPKIVFNVDNVPAAREILCKQDVVLGDIRSPAPGIQVCDGKDPEGNSFSIESHVNYA